MQGNNPNIYFRVCWLLLSPLLVLVRLKGDHLYDNTSQNGFQIKLKVYPFSFIVHIDLQHRLLHPGSLRRVLVPGLGRSCGLVRLTGLHHLDPTRSHSRDQKTQRLTSAGEHESLLRQLKERRGQLSLSTVTLVLVFVTIIPMWRRGWGWCECYLWCTYLVTNVEQSFVPVATSRTINTFHAKTKNLNLNVLTRITHMNMYIIVDFFSPL